MYPVTDSEFEYMIEPDAELDDIPVDGLSEVDVPGIREDSELGLGDATPTLYTGDVVVGIDSDRVRFVYLLQGATEDGIEVIPLDTGMHELISRDYFTALLLDLDDVVLYEQVVDHLHGWEGTQTVVIDDEQLPELSEDRR